MIIYGIKNCDTMQKAFKWLEENGVAYTFHDYREKGISSEKIMQWLKHHPINVIINTRSTTFRELTEAQKASIKDTKKAIKLMMSQTSMIKRPIVETGHEILVGFDPQVWDDHV